MKSVYIMLHTKFTTNISHKSYVNFVISSVRNRCLHRIISSAPNNIFKPRLYNKNADALCLPAKSIHIFYFIAFLVQHQFSLFTVTQGKLQKLFFRCVVIEISLNPNNWSTFVAASRCKVTK